MIGTIVLFSWAAAGVAQDSVKPQTFGDSAYAFIPAGNISWANANEQAKGMGGQLATIANSEENEFVKKLIKGKQAWLGAHKKDGPWKWLDGTPWSFQDFEQANPQDHLLIRSTGKWGGGFNKTMARNPTHGFICEWKADRAPTQIAMREAPENTSNTGGVTFFGVPLDVTPDPSPNMPNTGGKGKGKGRPTLVPEVVKEDYSKHFVDIQIGSDTTIGVLAKLNGKMYVLTAAHRLSGSPEFRMTTSNKKPVAAGKFFVSPTANLAAIEPDPSSLPEGAGFDVITDKAEQVELDSPILVLDGENEGSSGITLVTSRYLETDARLSVGGLAAVLDPKTKKLVGISTAGFDAKGMPAESGAKGKVILRIDANMDFQPLSWARWVKEREALDGLVGTTEILEKLVASVEEDRAIYVNDFQTNNNPLSSAVSEMAQSLSRSGLSAADQVKARESFLRQAASLSQRDISGFALSHFSGTYHQGLYQQASTSRTKIKRTLDSVGNDRNVVSTIQVGYRQEGEKRTSSTSSRPTRPPRPFTPKKKTAPEPEPTVIIK
ncbi:MAG: C-type lectin domain-containing protein [Verrucomicrobiota bacterium]